jgi:uncharacterized Zn-binding protein involved in type VI secretion
MAKPIARTVGICFAFPDMRQTPAPPGPPVTLPYPNIAQLSDATGTASNVIAGGEEVIVETSEIPSSNGAEAGSIDFVGATAKCEFTSASATVFANGKSIVRMGDTTSQSSGNASGTVMVGLPTVLVGD